MKENGCEVKTYYDGSVFGFFCTNRRCDYAGEPQFDGDTPSRLVHRCEYRLPCFGSFTSCDNVLAQINACEMTINKLTEWVAKNNQTDGNNNAG